MTTTTPRNSCTAQVWVDNSAGTLTNISGSATSVQLGPDVEIGEAKVFDSLWKLRLACGKDLPLTIAVVYSTTAHEGWPILRDWFAIAHGAARTVTIYMPDKNVGSDVVTGEFLLDDLDYSLDSSEAGPVIVTANIVPTGVVTYKTNAT